MTSWHEDRRRSHTHHGDDLRLRDWLPLIWVAFVAAAVYVAHFTGWVPPHVALVLAVLTIVVGGLLQELRRPVKVTPPRCIDCGRRDDRTWAGGLFCRECTPGDTNSEEAA